MGYNIKQVSEMTGLTEATLRYYDKEGLFPDLERKNSGYRIFSEREIEQIRYIECFKTAGFEIREIKEYFLLIKRGDETLKERYDVMVKHRKILEKKQEEILRSIAVVDKKIKYYAEAVEKGTEKGVSFE